MSSEIKFHFLIIVIINKQSENRNDSEWFINAEQFVATALTVQKLIEFIGARGNVFQALQELRNN